MWSFQDELSSDQAMPSAVLCAMLASDVVTTAVVS
jgi:hypothetical protein